MTWYTVNDFARKYSITENAVRDRIKRGTLKTRLGWKKVQVTEVLDEVTKYNLAQSIKKNK